VTVFFDISQLVADPRRAGIQRVERELIRHWPGPEPLVPCRFDPEARIMRELPSSVFAPLCADAAPGGLQAERRRLAPFATPLGRPVPEGATLLCAELFNDPARAAHYARPAGSDAFWLVYDFLPWTRPEWFDSRAAVAAMPYLQAMRAVRHLAFISEHTRDECFGRILRRPRAGTVIPLGADGLGLARQAFDPGRRTFVMLGAIEPRKNSAPVMRAFRHLWAEGCDVQLCMIGTAELHAMQEQTLLRELAGEPRFRHLQGLSDAGVRERLAEARAMLFPSEGEGYGIPPMEALHCGVPVVVSTALPALAGVPPWGQIRLDPVNEGTIAGAVRQLMDDGAAARLWAEAARLQLPGWREFARAVAAWVTAGRDRAPAPASAAAAPPRPP